MDNKKYTFADGARDGLPIGLGYLSVSFAFGIFAVKSGLPVWVVIAISMTNLTATAKQEKIGRLFKSTKGADHGLGLVRIDSIIDRLDGYLSRNSEDGAFTTEVLIPQV